MTKRTIATTALLATLLIGGISACNKSNSADAPAADAPQSTTTQSDTQSTTAQPQDRAQRREAMKKQIEAVLTPDQVKQLESKLQQGDKMRDAMASLNLTAEQKTKIREIYKSARAQRQGQSQTNSQ